MFKKERRRYTRLSTHHLIRYKVIEKKEQKDYHPFVRNISAIGILFYTEEYIPKDSIIEVFINFPTYHQAIKVMCRVVRVNPLKRVRGFEIGAEFIDIEKDAQDFINKKILSSRKKARPAFLRPFR